MPDKERDEKLRKEKILQKQLWIDRQERIKGTQARLRLLSLINLIIAEILDVDFNFFDGTTHMSRCSLKKAQTVHEVLEHARRTFPVANKFIATKSLHMFIYLGIEEAFD